jgi:hypothetical protein
VKVLMASGRGPWVAVARRPDLWPTAVRQWRAFCPRRWWSRWPLLPVPDRRYFLFRLEAMYGSTPARLEPAELVRYLEWCRSMRALVR